MSLRVEVVGIGPGDPAMITVQAVEALRGADAFLLVTKRHETQELVDVRAEILDRYVGEDWRSCAIYVADAERARGSDAQSQRQAVAAWRAERARRFAEVMAGMPDGARVAFLAWGDPTLYDSTLGVVEDIADGDGPEIEVRVIAGISSVQVLAAGHRIGLNRIGGSVQLMTGRRLADGLPPDAEDVVVMLDPECRFTEVAEEGLDIYWGAYLGTPDEILIAGAVSDVGEKIVRERAAAKARKGWVFDTYLLRRRRASRP